MLAYIFPAFIGSIVVATAAYALISPRLWMRKYGDGIYSPLRQVYKKAGSK